MKGPDSSEASVVYRTIRSDEKGAGSLRCKEEKSKGTGRGKGTATHGFKMQSSASQVTNRFHTEFATLKTEYINRYGVKS